MFLPTSLLYYWSHVLFRLRNFNLFFVAKHIGLATLNLMLWPTYLISHISEFKIHHRMFPGNYKIFFRTSFSLNFNKILILVVLIFLLVFLNFRYSLVHFNPKGFYVLTAEGLFFWFVTLQFTKVSVVAEFSIMEPEK